jgi:Glutamine amidotransferase domain
MAAGPPSATAGLAIIDLSEAGAQPMLDPDLGTAVVFNGCIYNYRRLRSELSDRYTFRSSSDTEVILKAYDRWGERFVEHLVGMFAFALVDRRRQRVLLAATGWASNPSTSPSRARATGSPPPPRSSRRIWPRPARTPRSTPCCAWTPA